MHALLFLTRGDLWIVITLGIHPLGNLQDIAWTELYADCAALAAFQQNINLSPGNMNFIDVQRDACLYFP